MSLKTLDWLTSKFVETILKNSESDDSIEVKELKTELAIGQGDNYSSQIIRAKVKYSRNESNRKVTETMSLIVKVAPMFDGVGKAMVEQFKAFETEIDMMQKTLPRISALLNEKDYRMTPRFFHGKIGDPSFIMMEDLTPLGYRMADRLIGLDLEHCLLAIRNLAKYHATSVALSEKDTKLPNMFKRGLYCVDHAKEWKQLCIIGFGILSKEVLNWPELGSERHIISDKISKLTEFCYDKAIKCVSQKGRGFNVLNHGDFWLNNMLFRYDDEGKLTDNIFIDFQLSLWNSPAIDLMHFLNTTPAEDVEIYHRETILTEYLKFLSKTMSSLGCKTKPPTMEALVEALKDYEFYGVMSAFVNLPFVLLDGKNVTFDGILQSNEIAIPAFKGQAYRRRMLRRLSAWNARGLFDI